MVLWVISRQKKDLPYTVTVTHPGAFGGNLSDDLDANCNIDVLLTPYAELEKSKYVCKTTLLSLLMEWKF
jgi:hypothetical protein